MTKSHILFGQVLCVTLLVSSTATAADFIMLHDVLPNQAPGGSIPRVIDVSSDGSTVIGSYNSIDGGRLFQWRRGIGVTILLDNSSQPMNAGGVAVSADGSTILGSGIDGVPFLWNENTGVTYINDLQSEPGKFFDLRELSGDGSTIVGNIYDDPHSGYNDTGGFVWNNTNGLVIIPRLPVANGNALYATNISDDGSSVVGFQSASLGKDTTPIRWTSSGGTSSLGKINGLPSGANSISANGDVIVGNASSLGQHFRWTQTTGWQMMDGLPGLGSDHTYVYNEVSADGKYIVGGQVISITPGTGVDPIIWDETFGARDLKTLFETVSGRPINNSKLGQAEQVSANGRVIAGTGSDSTDGWVMVFGPSELKPEPGDYDRNGVVDARDYVVWRNGVGHVVPRCSGGDANCNGFVEWEDYGPWSENYGRSYGSGSAFNAIIAVPEPSSLAILWLGLALFGFRRDCRALSVLLTQIT